MKRRYAFFLVLSTLLILSSVLAAPLLNNSVVQPWQVTSAGNTTVTVGEVTLRGTLGQPLVGQVAVGDVTLRQGFWVGVESAWVWLLSLPLILK